MRDTWTDRVRRAVDLSRSCESARSLLDFYAVLLSSQKQLYDAISGSRRIAAVLEEDRDVFRDEAGRLLAAVAAHGPEPLAGEARRLAAAGDAGLDDELADYWHAPSDRAFFAKAILQPYAQSLHERGMRAEARRAAAGERSCPFCGGAPQVAVLDTLADSHGSARQLVCGTCLASWPCRRVVCVRCGEEDERRLAYYESAAFAHLRVDACDTCRSYLKTVDRTRLGLAVPVVDEVAGAALDVWARERGYQKIELNLVGL